MTGVTHLYAAIALSLAAPSATLTGLDHLEGAAVQIWTDEGAYGPLTVTGGALVLPDPVSTAIVGLADTTQIIASLDLYGAVADGNSLGRVKRIKAIGLRLHRTAGLEVRVVETRGDGSEIAGRWISALSRSVAATDAQAFSGVVDLPAPSGHAREVRVEMRPVGPAPATVLALTPILETADG